MPDEALLQQLLQLKNELEQTIDELTDAKAFWRTLHARALTDQAPSMRRDLGAFNATLTRAQTRLRRTQQSLASFRQLRTPTRIRQTQR